jgi:ATP-independent RNA helicase DbpA
MTPIQAQALPFALAGRDLIAQAETGSGKTAAFALPLLIGLNQKDLAEGKKRVQGLVLCPTRELSSQVAAEIRRLARYQENIKVVILSGGQSIGPQIGSLEHGAHVVVGTPGRIKDHLRKQTLDLSEVKTLVLDEADRMLHMGFMEDMETIISHTPKDRQTLLFSATFPENIKALSAQFQRTPEQVKVESQHKTAAIEQRLYLSGRQGKLDSLIRVLQNIQVPSAVVFCNMKQTTEEVAKYLDSRRFNAQALHGDLEQKDRDRILTQFKHQSCNVLVATDVAARGLDVEDLPAVINYDLPRDPEIYVHRIGRTARAGKEGIAVSLLDENERYKLDKIADYLGDSAQGNRLNLENADDLEVDEQFSMLPRKKTLVIAGGRKDKVRPGDVLGALTGEAGIPGNAVGKIDISDFSAYVTIDSNQADKALEQLRNGKIKGRRFKVRKL